MARTKKPTKTGRPPKFTPEQFAAEIDAFIEHCEVNDVEPDDYNLIKYMHISPSSLDRYRAGDNCESTNESSFKDRDKTTYQGFGSALKKLDLFRQHYALEQVKSDPRLAGHVAFKLKQPHWGGWTDKQESTKDLNINIKIGDSGAKLLD